MSIDPFATATELTGALRRKEISSRELLRDYLDRVSAHNGEINAVVTLDADRALKDASAADDEGARGDWRGPLHGLPITIKDCFETEGLRTTCGDPALTDYVPTQDALAVARLKASGAIVFGKTNTPWQTLDVQTYNAVFGATNNPWDVTRVPGGSSGGSAAALAAGLTTLELGSDIGGSIRIPAHCCGVFGHKPSWGIVPERGHIPGPPGSLHRRDINCNGPLARSVDDLELALDVIAGPDELDTAAWQLHLPQPRHTRLQDFRVAAWLDDPFCKLQRASLGVLEGAVTKLGAAGALVDCDGRPPFGLEEALDVLNPLLQGAISGITQTSIPHHEWLALEQKRQVMRRQWAHFFSRFDVLLLPVLFTAAFPHTPEGDFQSRTITVDGGERRYRDVTAWTVFVGGVHLPSTVIPAGRTQSGLPVGVQVVGNFLDDRTTLAFARAASAELGGFQRPPGY